MAETHLGPWLTQRKAALEAADGYAGVEGGATCWRHLCPVSNIEAEARSRQAFEQILVCT